MTRNRQAGTLVWFVLTVALIGAAVPPARAGPASSRLAFAAFRNGQWDLYSVDESGGDLRQLTDDACVDRDPAYSPDGMQLAYASRCNRNWDVYVMELDTGRKTRVTDHPAYDGAPAWSPDGSHIAFESARGERLDIWVVDVGGDELRNLTADSAAGNFGPSWSPDGSSIAFTSWRHGYKDLFALDVASGVLTQLTEDSAAEEWPAWQPDGRQLAFVRNWLGEREIYLMDVPSGKTRPTPVTWFGRDDGPAWAPDGHRIGFLNWRYDGQRLMVLTPGSPEALPVPLTDIGWLDGRPGWSDRAVNYGTPAPTLGDSQPFTLYREKVVPSKSGEGEPWDLVVVKGIRLPTPDLTPYLSDRVDDSFRALRRRLADEVGYDFLSALSEAYRPYQYLGDNSQYASWHKSGRAIDTLFDFDGQDGQMLEIVRDDMAGETYWRVYLRCSDQSGACGRPLTSNTWDYSHPARADIAPDQGGVEKPASGLYYVDLTALMREYGWTPIASWDNEEFSWTWHFKAFEYWHFQKTHDLTWYAAMQEVIAPHKLDQAFTVDRMLELGDYPFRIALKGVPLPAEARLWWSQLRP
jgi:TolB protein